MVLCYVVSLVKIEMTCFPSIRPRHRNAVPFAAVLAPHKQQINAYCQGQPQENAKGRGKEGLCPKRNCAGTATHLVSIVFWSSVRSYYLGQSEV